MVRFASRKTRHHAALSEDFERELTREVLRTELLRVRALIMTGCIMMVLLTAIYLIEPSVVNRVWRGTEGIVEVYGLLAGFIVIGGDVDQVVLEDVSSQPVLSPSASPGGKAVDPRHTTPELRPDPSV